jgi:hypothetical protein
VESHHVSHRPEAHGPVAAALHRRSAHLAPLKKLSSLNLSGTPVTNDGLKHLAVLEALSRLDLHETKVTDAGLKQLAGFKGLTFLNLQGAKVTREAAAELRRALPRCRIDR